MMHGHTYIKQL